MNVERLLVSKAIQSGQIERLIGTGIEPEHFQDEGCKKVWEAAIEHVRKYKAAPSLAAFKDTFTEFSFELSTDTLDYLTDRFVAVVKQRLVQDALYNIAEEFNYPDRLENIDITFLEYAREISTKIPSSSRVARFSDMYARIESYKEAAAHGSPMGIPFGVEKFDRLTLGTQPHEFICIVGWQGTGKSTLLQWYFFNAYMAGKTPLLFSLEMEAESLFRKWDTMAVHFEYYARKAMELEGEDMERWEKWADRARSASNNIIVLDDLGRCTVEKIYAETVRYKPDLVGVDYISLMDAPRNVGALWEKVTYLTQGLKHNARSLNIPVFGVAQTNINSASEGAKLENISYSRSIGQDADIVFGLDQDDDMRAQKQMEVRLLKNRDGKIANVSLQWNMERMEFKELTPDDLFQNRGLRDGNHGSSGQVNMPA